MIFINFAKNSEIISQINQHDKRVTVVASAFDDSLLFDQNLAKMGGDEQYSPIRIRLVKCENGFQNLPWLELISNMPWLSRKYDRIVNFWCQKISPVAAVFPAFLGLRCPSGSSYGGELVGGVRLWSIGTWKLQRLEDAPPIAATRERM